MADADIIIVPSEVSKHSAIGNSVLKNVNGNDRTKELKCQVDLGSGKTKCCVLNCSTNTLPSINKSQITFVTFPKDPSRFTEWTRAIDRSDLSCYIGKKDATNLLICSKHFPENMWINSNTRIKRLHKSAVPEINADEEDDIITLTPPVEKSPSKRGGLKIKKVSSLLSDTAFRESLSMSGRESPILILPEVTESVNTPNSKTGRKWQSVLQRQKALGSTELEKKLLAENGQLKSELDKNMDYILNQKTHYEGLLSKEQEKSEDLEAKIRSLETSQRKLWHTYESQLQAQRTVANSKEFGQKEVQAKLKLLREKNEDLEKQLMEETMKTNYLTLTNEELQQKIDDLASEDSMYTPSAPLSVERDFSGEKFKEYLDFYLMKEKQLEDKVEALSLELDQMTSPEGQKEKLLYLAAQHLNHMQLSFLERSLNVTQEPKKEFENHFRELCSSIYESSEACYIKCAKAFGFPPVETVREWALDVTVGKRNSSSTINALYEEGEQVPKNLFGIDSDKEGGIINTERESKGKVKRRSVEEYLNPFKKVKSDDDDEDEDEGRASDEDEEIVFTESDEEEEEEDEEEDEKVEEEEEEEEEEEDEDEEDPLKEEPLSQRDVEIPSTSEDFDFILEADEELEASRSSTDQIGSSMPLLVPDSPLTPIPSIDQPTSEMKISNRKKVISSDTSLPSGSKVIFRVIES